MASTKPKKTPRAPRNGAWPRWSPLRSLPQSTFSVIHPSSLSSEVPQAFGDNDPGALEGLLFKSVVPMRLSSLMKRLPLPSPKPELSLMENSQPSGKLEGRGREKGKG